MSSDWRSTLLKICLFAGKIKEELAAAKKRVSGTIHPFFWIELPLGFSNNWVSEIVYRLLIDGIESERLMPECSKHPQNQARITRLLKPRLIPTFNYEIQRINILRGKLQRMKVLSKSRILTAVPSSVFICRKRFDWVRLAVEPSITVFLFFFFWEFSSFLLA